MCSLPHSTHNILPHHDFFPISGWYGFTPNRSVHGFFQLTNHFRYSSEVLRIFFGGGGAGKGCHTSPQILFCHWMACRGPPYCAGDELRPCGGAFPPVRKRQGGGHDPPGRHPGACRQHRCLTSGEDCPVIEIQKPAVSTHFYIYSYMSCAQTVFV